MPPAQRPRACSRIRKSKAWPARTIAPAEHPASDRAALVRVGQGRARRALPPGPAQVAGLAARQVDEVGLADRLGRGRVVRPGAVAHEDRLDLGAEPAKCATPIDAQRWKTVLAVGV